MPPYPARAAAWFGRVMVLLAVLAWGGGAAASGDLTLEKCIELAVAHDPETQNARHKVEIGRLKRSKAVQDFLPRLDVYVTYGPQTDYFGRPVTDQNVYYTGVGLEQPLYKGGTLTNGVKLAEAETNRQELEYHFRKLAVASDAIKAYYDALSVQAAIQHSEVLLRQGEADLREAEARLAGGRGTRLEVLELSVKLLEVQQRLSKARTDYQVKLSGLKKIIGLDDDRSLSLINHHPLQDINGDLPALLQEAQSRRPDLKAGREDMTYNQLKTDIESGKRWPKLSLVARQEWESPEMVSGKKRLAGDAQGLGVPGQHHHELQRGAQRALSQPLRLSHPAGVSGPHLRLFGAPVEVLHIR